MPKLKVNDRVYLPEVIDVWAEVHEKGTVVEVSVQGYTVMFDGARKLAAYRITK